MEANEQEKKQNYLRENILEKGYDANIFINFLKSKKGEEGADISNWSFPDLQEVVREFTSLGNTGNLQNQETKPNEPDENNKQNINKNEQINQNSENLKSLKEEDFGIIIPDFVECRKSEETELCKYKDLEITVNEPKKVDKGFFSKAYIDFEIKTNPLNLIVRKQNSEFVWLRERLSTIFNTNILPRLPKKGKVNGDLHIQKRMRNLEKFLYYLTKDPLIKSSQILFDFLSIQNEEEYNKRKKIYNKMKTPSEFNDIKTLDGKAKIKITELKEKNIEKIKNNAAFNETALKKINNNFKILNEEMNTIIRRVLSFSPLFEKLIKISTTFSEDNIIIESYKQMQNLFNSWATILKKQNSFFCNDIKEYLKLLSGNYHHIRELSQYVENQKNNYYKISQNLMSKKIELFRKGETSNWQLDINERNQVKEFCKNRLTSYKKICYKDTINTIKTKEKYGYYLNRLISEYVRIKNINAFENKDKIRQFAKKQGQIMSEYFKQMGEIILLIDGCMINDVGENFIEQNSEPSLEVNKLEYNNLIQQQKSENQDENNNNKINE